MFQLDGQVSNIKSIGPKDGQYGVYYNHYITVNGQEYSLKGNEPNPPVQIGQTVTGQFTQNNSNGKVYNNIIAKTFVGVGGAPQQYQQAPQQAVQQPQGQPVPQQQPVFNGGGTQLHGAQVGNALNNAATILGAGASLAQLEETARAIIEISTRLANGTPAPVGNVQTASAQNVVTMPQTQNASTVTTLPTSNQQPQPQVQQQYQQQPLPTPTNNPLTY